MPKMTFGITGAVGEEFPENKPIKPGTYKGSLKVLRAGKIKKDGPNKGKVRLNVGVQLTEEGAAKGRIVWTGLNVTDQGVPYVNQFLSSLTNGSQAAKLAIQKSFWEDANGGVVAGGDSGEEVLKIGKYAVKSPEGTLPLTVTVKDGKDQDGNKRSEIGRFLTIVKESEDEDEDSGVASDPDEDEDEEAVSPASSSEEEDEEPPF